MSPIRNLSWLPLRDGESRLGGAAYPSDDDLAELSGLGVGLLVNLSEHPHLPAALARCGLAELNLPVEDFTAPTVEQLDQGVRAISDWLGGGGKAVVHCGGGYGRTGTLLAAYLVSLGVPPGDAIASVRAARPGSIETGGQARAVRAYAEWLSARR